MKRQDKHFFYIKKLYPDAISVVKPITVGKVHDVYIAECKNNKYICRFSDKITAEHNLYISKILQKYDIPVPKVSIYDCDDCWCESYPFVEGKTLHERLLEGLSDEKLDVVYNQIWNLSCKISNIPYNKKFDAPVPFISKCSRKAISLINLSQKKLCHADLHAKNVILDESDNVRALIDLDSIAPEYLSVAYFTIMKDAVSYGYDINKLKLFYETLNIKKLRKQIKIFNFVTRIYRIAFSDRIRKQLLKIRVK